MTVFINNRFVENENAVLNISDLSIQRGYGIFDFFRVANNQPLFVEDHLDRFYASANAMRLPVNKTRKELLSVVHQLINQSGFTEGGIRLTLTGGYSSTGYHIADPNLIITFTPVAAATEADFEKGHSIITYEHQRELPLVKSINYLTAVWLQPMLKEKEADDVLYFNKESITEFPRSNIFMVTEKNVLVTPAHNMLRGITRKNVLLLAKDILQIEERDITVEELLTAKEVFATATTRKLIPVLKINNQSIGNGRLGKTTRILYQKFTELENRLTHLVSL